MADKEPASVATFPAAAAAAASVSAAATTPQQGGLKRPRDPSSRSKLPPVEESFATPPSGQSGGEAGGGDDSNANDSSLSVKSSPTAAQEESESSLWMTQVGDGLFLSEVELERFFGAQSRSTLFVAASRVAACVTRTSTILYGEPMPSLPPSFLCATKLPVDF